MFPNSGNILLLQPLGPSMGTERFYRPGSFYRIDDRTGFATRAERTRTEWNGLIVSDRVWEARQPQDFVKGVADNQTVPYPRPRQPNPDVYSSHIAEFNVLGGKIVVSGGQFYVYTRYVGVNPANFPSGF